MEFLPHHVHLQQEICFSVPLGWGTRDSNMGYTVLGPNHVLMYNKITELIACVDIIKEPSSVPVAVINQSPQGGDTGQNKVCGAADSPTETTVSSHWCCHCETVALTSSWLYIFRRYISRKQTVKSPLHSSVFAYSHSM